MFADEMSQDIPDNAHEEWSLKVRQIWICGDVSGFGPKKIVRKFAAAVQDGEVTRLLDEKARLVRLECKSPLIR